MCVCYLLGNVVAFNEEDVDFVHEPAVWPGLRGVTHLTSLGVIWDSSKAGGRHRPNLHSFPCLVGDATCPPSTQLEPSAEALHKASCRAVSSS